jgi:hypothetical protein
MAKTISAAARSRTPVRVTIVPRELRFFWPSVRWRKKPPD